MESVLKCWKVLVEVEVVVEEAVLELARGVEIPKSRVLESQECLHLVAKMLSEAKTHERELLTFGSLGRLWTALIFGGAFSAPQTGLGKSSVSFASSFKRYAIGLGTFFIFFGASNRSIS